MLISIFKTQVQIFAFNNNVDMHIKEIGQNIAFTNHVDKHIQDAGPNICIQQ